jgi:hypothetical protein
LEDKLSSTAKTILFWCALLVTAVLLYAVGPRTSLPAQTGSARSGEAKPKRKIEYNVIQVEPSIVDIREKLASAASIGWEFVGPVMQDGTTTALIFKREN